MVECGVLPTGCSMTCRANRAELTVMGILRGMAGNTFPGCALIDTIYMAGCALHANMAARQRKAGPAVIEIHIFPSAWVMAGTTIRSELPVMGVLRGMTGKTIGWCAFIDAVGMAGGTCTALVAPKQSEARLAVVKVNILPVGWGVAFRAIHAHLPRMNIHMT